MNKLLILFLLLTVGVILSSCGKVYRCYSENGKRTLAEIDTLIGEPAFKGRYLKSEDLNKICEIIRKNYHE